MSDRQLDSITESPSAATATRLEKVAVDNGFDRELPRQTVWLGFASTQTTLQLWLTATDDMQCMAALSQVHVDKGLDEFGRPVDAMLPDGAVASRAVSGMADLHRLVRRAFQLSRTLPDALLRRFEHLTVALPRATEVERLVLQRIGQDLFRDGLIDYWEGRCAMSGLTVVGLLRASHIKPWGACATDAERLDVFNGLLLAPHLDAAFDQGFITVADNGSVVVGESLDLTARGIFGLQAPLGVRLAQRHLLYLQYHRANVFRG